ncbi:MAG: hypothetical protein AB8C02_06240 [Halioglobus sp.]
MAQSLWALEHTFDGDPAAPSQTLLPDNFDFAVTHRIHSATQLEYIDQTHLFTADHGVDCSGPMPIAPGSQDTDQLNRHDVSASHNGNGATPPENFFICKNHMMSAMGDISSYSVAAFWPKQSFDFSGSGGVLEFDVNINGDHERSWFEVMITPRDQLKVGSAMDYWPISETYPEDRIVLLFGEGHGEAQRKIAVGNGALAPAGWTVNESDWRFWHDAYPQDPANTDRRIRRKNRIGLTPTVIVWQIEKADGSFDNFTVPLPEGLPFTRGLVVFKTHAYTPEKENNFQRYTFHWDNIRFTGPVVGIYDAFESSELIHLEANGDRTVGESQSTSIDLPYVSDNPVLFGQVHSPVRGEVLLRVNDGDPKVVNPANYSNENCSSEHYSSFRVPLSPDELQVGTNTFEWIIGERSCGGGYPWVGFSVKGLEVQMEPPPPPGC